MKQRDMLVECIKIYIVVLFCVFIVMLVGCAEVPLLHDQCNATKFQTAHEHEQCLKLADDYQEYLDEKEDKRLVRRDKLIAFLNSCHASEEYVLIEKRHGRGNLPTKREQHKRTRAGLPVFTHDNVRRHAQLGDYGCMRPQDIKEQIERSW